jgi:hypothetical protein
MPQATSTEYGNSLFNVHMLKKKNQVIVQRNVRVVSYFDLTAVSLSMLQGSYTPTHFFKWAMNHKILFRNVSYPPHCRI